ncbi:MAG: hypothetical protein HYX75_24790 [Acidobacteria bacterium]|nr:hypothetical protein [Acidobacteriota bacterium]
MRTSTIGSLTIGTALIAQSLLAQEKPGVVAQIFVAKAKPGMEQQLEEGAKKHMGWHRSQKDPVPRFTWQVLTGERMGQYIVGAFGFHWKDLDARADFEKADDADAMVSVFPYVESLRYSIYAALPDVSRPRMGTEPARMSQVTHFIVKPGGVDEFLAGLRQIRDTADNAKWGSNFSWYQLASGGEGPQFALALSRGSWADFEPPAKSFDAMLFEAHGAMRTADLLTSVRDNVTSQYTETIMYRPDLSYIPAPAK